MPTPPGKPLRILFEGEELAAEPGDTVAATLLRAGVTSFSRGPKYHRPRGPFCFAGTCAQCHMRVDGEPNVPTCQTPVREGLEVQRQNVLGTGDTDLLRAVDFIYREKLDHHHLMTHFRALSAATQAIARRLAGIGERPGKRLEIAGAEVLRVATVIIGGGPAGLAAARAAAGEALLLEQEAALGGRVRAGFAVSDEVSRPLPARVSVRLSTRAIGLYEEGGSRFVLAHAEGRLVRISCDRAVVATGGTERPLLFEANDLPGVVAGRGLLRMVRDHRIFAGTRVVVVGSSPDALVVARGLRAAGLSLQGLVDPEGSLAGGADVEVLGGAQPVRAMGRTKVQALRIRDGDGREARLSCELVAVVARRQPSFELAAEVGARTEFREDCGGFVVVTDAAGVSSVPWVSAAGLVAGVVD